MDTVQKNNLELVKALYTIFKKYKCSEIELLEAIDMIPEKFKEETCKQWETVPFEQSDKFYTKLKGVDAEPLKPVNQKNSKQPRGTPLW